MEYQITCNEKGTRHISITTEHLNTLRQYDLLSRLVPSNGIVDQEVVDLLRLRARALLDSAHPQEDLAVLCRDVIFHDNMKAKGLQELIQLYNSQQGIPEAVTEEVQ